VAVARLVVPTGLLVVVVLDRPAGGRVPAVVALVALWTAVYVRYRARGRETTQLERQRLADADWEAVDRYYKAGDATIQEAFEVWGAYHQHRHEMRYDLVAAAVREHLPARGAVLDVGCGGGLVAERLKDVAASYVGVDIPARSLQLAAQDRVAGEALRTAWASASGDGLPFPDATFDVVVFSEVIEHLLRPELAVWEIGRVLRPGGVLVMTTNNASEMPGRSPLTHLFAWLEKALGATRPGLISLRPWVWPQPVDPAFTSPGSAPVYLAHTHHIYGETRTLFAQAGLATVRWSTFEFPPPQSATSARLERWGAAGRRTVDVIEAVASRTPLVRRLGCHLMVVSRKVGPPVAEEPPAGVWPGPFSGAVQK
jgi:2-polyprenyl-6-hydroxyphenyl methylase/3-demethylubiquinone-9 3-methyltransferase